MKTDVRRKVANVELNGTRCLQPLFEAIMNAIHAVQEAKVKDDRIVLEVTRNIAQKELFEDISEGTIRLDKRGFPDGRLRAPAETGLRTDSGRGCSRPMSIHFSGHKPPNFR